MKIELFQFHRMLSFAIIFLFIYFYYSIQSIRQWREIIIYQNLSPIIISGENRSENHSNFISDSINVSLYQSEKQIHVDVPQMSRQGLLKEAYLRKFCSPQNQSQSNLNSSQNQTIIEDFPPNGSYYKISNLDNYIFINPEDVKNNASKGKCSGPDWNFGDLFGGFNGPTYRYESPKIILETNQLCDRTNPPLAVIGIISTWSNRARRDVVC